MVAAGAAMWYVGEDGGSMAGHEHEAVEAVKLCMALGNDVNAKNSYGETPLHGAAFRGVNEIVEYLVEKGAALDARGAGEITAAADVVDCGSRRIGGRCPSSGTE